MSNAHFYAANLAAEEKLARQAARLSRISRELEQGQLPFWQRSRDYVKPEPARSFVPTSDHPVHRDFDLARNFRATMSSSIVYRLMMLYIIWCLLYTCWSNRQSIRNTLEMIVEPLARVVELLRWIVELVRPRLASWCDILSGYYYIAAHSTGVEIFHIHRRRVFRWIGRCGKALFVGLVVSAIFWPAVKPFVAGSTAQDVSTTPDIFVPAWVTVAQENRMRAVKAHARMQVPGFDHDEVIPPPSRWLPALFQTGQEDVLPVRSFADGPDITTVITTVTYTTSHTVYVGVWETKRPQG